MAKLGQPLTQLPELHPGRFGGHFGVCTFALQSHDVLMAVSLWLHFRQFHLHGTSCWRRGIELLSLHKVCEQKRVPSRVLMTPNMTGWYS